MSGLWENQLLEKGRRPSVSKATYNLEVHKAVYSELELLPEWADDKLRNRLKTLKETEQPTEPNWAKSLSDHPDLFRVRVTDYRAICGFQKPTVYVLVVGEREGMYDNLETAKQRLNG